MARYIDADAMSLYFDALIKHAEMEGLYNMSHVYERCLRIVKDAPTADVAPRTELAREIFGEIEILKNSCVKTELFKGSWFEMRAFEDGLSELKKKYTGEP